MKKQPFAFNLSPRPFFLKRSKQAFLILCTLLAMLFVGCADRNATPDPSPQLSEGSPQNVSREEETSPPPSSSQLEETSQPEEEESFQPPLLAETEITMLEENLSLFIRTLGEAPLESTASLSKDQVLAACTAEIDRTKDLNAYILMKNDAGIDLISGELIAETAQRLFGIESFDYKESPLYDEDTRSFEASATLESAPKYTLSEMMGTEDGSLVAYEVTFEDGAVYLYHTAIYRQNSMPYLQLVNVTQIPSQT